MKIVSSILFFSLAACSFKFWMNEESVVGIQGLDPENDSIYDPAIGKMTIKSQRTNLPFSAVSPSSSHLSTPNTSLPNTLSSNSYDSSITDPVYIPEPTSTPTQASHDRALSAGFFEYSSYPPASNYYDSTQQPIFHIPFKCLKYKIRWYFHHGYPENNTPALGAISRLGNAREMIFDLNLSNIDTVYSLISVNFSANELSQVLPNAYSLKITCDDRGIYHNLLSLSKKLESNSMISSLVIAVNLIFTNYAAYIQIVFNYFFQNQISLYQGLRDEIKKMYPVVSAYTPYWV